MAITFFKGVPDELDYLYPHRDRPRTDNLFGVTEILYCLRKAFLGRKIPAPTHLDMATRQRFARGHLFEALVFGEKQNAEYFIGDGELDHLEGHADHVVRNDKKDIEAIMEFKSVKKVWLTADNGKKYFSYKQARAAGTTAELKYNQSHMDQLMIYMVLSGAPKGYLIYYQLSDDKNFTWTIEQEDISDEFKQDKINRLNILKYSLISNKPPVKCPPYEFECQLCNFGRSGICKLCDQKDFSVDDFSNSIIHKKYAETFDDIISKYRKRFGIEEDYETSFDDTYYGKNGESKALNT